jgi:transposase-like protein
VINKSMDALEWLRRQLETDGNDLLREMVRSLAEALMGADADVVCGAPCGESSPERVNRCNGYRIRRWDTRVGRLTWPSRSYGPGRTSRSGCWMPALGRSGPSSKW